MASLRQDPYLWIHLAGLATVPIWLDVCLMGLAVSPPTLSPWLELGGLILFGSGPILWMQLKRPFYIFSLLAVAVQPKTLSDRQRTILSLQKTWQSRLLILVGAIALVFILASLYAVAPAAAGATPLADQPRRVGLLVSGLGFLLANLFVQVPATTLPPLLASSAAVVRTEPYPAANILGDFTVFGLRLSYIFPERDEQGAVPDAEQPES